MYKIVFLFLVAISIMSCNKPVASFLIESEDFKAPAEVSFVNNSENASAYEWDFGDGNMSDASDPSHRYLRSGVYEVKLTAKEGDKRKTITKELTVKTPDRCLVEIRTSMGNMIAELYDDTPKHQDNFLKLAEQGYYDSLLFHRVINGFMIQGGDPGSRNAGKNTMLGSGGPGYKIPAEFRDTLAHLKGALAAARQGDQVNPKKESSGSQFYIVQGKIQSDSNLEMMERRKGKRYPDDIRQAYTEIGGTPFLDGEYTVFGRIIEGLDVIDKIASVKTGPGDRPEKNVYMEILPIR